MVSISFVLGMFTVVFAIMIAIIVAGIVKIKKITEEIKCIHKDIFYIDSRIDKLTSKRDVLKG